MSFHNNFEKWKKQTDPKYCPVCKNEPMPEGMIDLYELEYSFLNSEPNECMKYACHITSKFHGIELFDLTDDELFKFMKDVKIYAYALKKATNAIKINYEIHGNTAPHLHLHLYPRFLDDPFPDQAINYKNKSINIYQIGEYDDFVENMRKELNKIPITE